MFLLCLDNADKIIDEDKDEFVAFLADLNDYCEDLHIFVTSNITMGQLPNQTFPKPYLLKPLHSQESATIFHENCGNLALEDVVEFIFEDKNFPLKKFVPEISNSKTIEPEPLQKLQKEKLLEQIQNKDVLISALAAHDMFR